jgi:hypothetical protein
MRCETFPAKQNKTRGTGDLIDDKGRVPDSTQGVSAATKSSTHPVDGWSEVPDRSSIRYRHFVTIALAAFLLTLILAENVDHVLWPA